MTRRAATGVAGTVAATVLAVAALAWSTQGFRALTLDGARAAAVANRPRPVPSAHVQDADGAAIPIAVPGMVTVVDFVSTACLSVCLAQGSAFALLQDSLGGGATSADRRIRLVTVSFDPDDDASRLRGWAEAQGATAPSWRVGRVAADDRRRLLETFGIVLVRDPVAGWRHNAAFHLVDGGGAVRRIIAANDPVGALRAARLLVDVAPDAGPTERSGRLAADRAAR